MEGGFRIYNVEPLSEKARVGKFLYVVYSTMYILSKIKYFLSSLAIALVLISTDCLIIPANHIHGDGWLIFDTD